MSESWFDPESPEHPFERVSWHMIGEYGPICRWCGLLREVHDGLIDPPKEEEKVSDRLNEAIKWCQDRLAQQPNADDEWRDVVEAARAYADLLVNGERVEWCEEHEFQIKSGANVCLASPFTTKSCRRIGDRLLIDHPKRRSGPEGDPEKEYVDW